MKTTFKNITTIQTGVFAKPIPKGEIVYLQAKHFDENGELTNTLYPDLKADGKIEKHLLKTGDVLFAAKGTKNFAACYETENIPAVASTSFFVIRLQTEEILPGYLTISHLGLLQGWEPVSPGRGESGRDGTGCRGIAPRTLIEALARPDCR